MRSYSVIPGIRTPGTPQPFQQKFGIAGAAVDRSPVERGIARLLGLEDLFVGPMGPDQPRDSNRGQQRLAPPWKGFRSSTSTSKAPIEPGHDGDARLKQSIIESIDASFFGPFMKDLDWSRFRLAVTADNSTVASSRPL